MIARIRQILEGWWIRLFHTQDQVAENQGAAKDPYREGPSSEPKLEHAPDCEGCAFMKKHGPWKPPEVILAAGLPAECLMIGYKMTTMAELDDFAESCGLNVVREQSAEPEKANG